MNSPAISIDGCPVAVSSVRMIAVGATVQPGMVLMGNRSPYQKKVFLKSLIGKVGKWMNNWLMKTMCENA